MPARIRLTNLPALALPLNGLAPMLPGSMASGPRVSATTDVAATVLRWDDSVRSCTIPGRDDMVREGTDLRSLSWSHADFTANKARERARKSAPVSDADSVDTAAFDNSLGTIASALSCVDHVASVAT